MAFVYFPWMILAVVAALGRVAYVLWRSVRPPKTMLTPDWKRPEATPEKRRSRRRTILLTLLFDPFVIFLLILVLVQVFGPIRPIHEWIR